MKTIKWTYFILIVMTLFCFSNVFAQYEDELLGEEEQEDVICIPENMETSWDSLKNRETDQDIALLYNFGSEYFKNKSYKEALPYLWEVYLKDSDRYARNALRRIAEIYFNQSMVDSTLLICYRGLKRFPNQILLHYYAGLLQNRLGKSKCAIPHYEALVEKDSTNLNYTKTLAFLYFKDENEKCIKVQEIVVKLNPDDPEESNTLAQYMSHFYGQDAVLDIRKKNFEDNPTNIDYAQSYAQVAASAGKFQEALVPLNVILNNKPSTKFYLLRAEVYENLNQNNNAIDDYKSILKKETKNYNVMLRISVNYRNSNNFSSAKYWVRQALSAKPGYGLAYITMGEIYEAAVIYCQNQRGGKGTFEDKLVYDLAKKEYEKAKNDPAFRSTANKKRDAVKPFIPSKEDYFMHKNDKIKSACYKF